MAKSVLQQAGFAGELLDTMLGIEWIECYDPVTKLHYYDAIGDTDKVDQKWRPSAGPGQIRALWDPFAWGVADRWRRLPELLDPHFNARACFAICANGTKFDLWSAFKSGSYLPHKGEDFELHSGHKRAHLWDITEPVPL